MLTLAPTATLQLHVVPAGRRLDFSLLPGHFAYVYRRSRGRQWECVARNAHSPYLDYMPTSPDTSYEYVVQYRDAQSSVVSQTPIVRVTPMVPVDSAAPVQASVGVLGA
jgi:hypothetical protein